MAGDISTGSKHFLDLNKSELNRVINKSLATKNKIKESMLKNKAGDSDDNNNSEGFKKELEMIALQDIWPTFTITQYL